MNWTVATTTSPSVTSVTDIIALIKDEAAVLVGIVLAFTLCCMLWAGTHGMPDDGTRFVPTVVLGASQVTDLR